MEARAHAQTGNGKSSDSVAARAKNPYLITFDEWRACFGYVPGSEWTLAKATSETVATRERLRARLRKLDAWSGQVHVLGHSQGLEHLCVGGLAATKSVPDHHHGLVTGAEFGQLLRAVLPLERAPVVDVVLLVPWLGNHQTPRTAAFLLASLREIGAPDIRAQVHATPYETWPSPWDDIRVNGARADATSRGHVHDDPLGALRRAVLEHASTGTIGTRKVSVEIDRDFRRVVERQVLHPVGVAMRSIEDVALVTHLAQRSAAAFEEHRAFMSFFLDGSRALAVDRTLSVYAEHRRGAALAAARVQPVEATIAGSGDVPPEHAPKSPFDRTTTQAKARAEGAEDLPRSPNSLARRPEIRKSSEPAVDASESPNEPPAQEEGFETIDPWDPSSIRRRRPPVAPGDHELQTVEGFNEVPQRPKDDDRQQAREVGVEGPFMQKHAWQRERSFWESQVVEIDGAHAAPNPRRFNQFMRDHDETDPGHFTLPIRDWELDIARRERPREEPPVDEPRPPPVKPQDPEWVPGSLLIGIVGNVAAEAQWEAERVVRGRVCKGIDEATVAAAIAKLAADAEQLLRDAAAAKQGALPSASVDVKLTAFEPEDIRRAVNAQVSGFANEKIAETTLVTDLAAFVASLGAEMHVVQFSALVRGARSKLSEPSASSDPAPVSGAGLTELSSAFFSYTSKDAWSDEAPDEKVKANALLADPSFKRVFRTGANDYSKVASHVANALSKEKQQLEIRVYHHPDKRAVGERRAAALKKLWEYEQKLKGGGQEETFSKKAWLKTVAISIRYIPRTDPKLPNVITFAVAGRGAGKPVPTAKPVATTLTWEGSSVHVDARWACCTAAHEDPALPVPPGPKPLPVDPKNPDPEEPKPPTPEKPEPHDDGGDDPKPNPAPIVPPILDVPEVPDDPAPVPPVVTPVIPPFVPPVVPPFVLPPVPVLPPVVPPIDVPLVPPRKDEDDWVPGSLAIAVSGDVPAAIDDAAKRAVNGRVCKGVSEEAVATAAKQLVMRTEALLREAAAAKVGGMPSAHLALRLTAFDAKSIRQAVVAAVSSLPNGDAFEKTLAADVAGFAATLHAELEGLSFEAQVQGMRANAPSAPDADDAGDKGAGLMELSSAFFSYTSKDAWSNEAPDEKVKANALLADAGFRRVFRTGANDYAKVASHVANALSKEKQRLEIRVYHHADRQQVGLRRAAALKKLWEHEQKLTGGGEAQVFSKRAWLKTVAISIRYIPLTDPKLPNVIKFAVGGHAAPSRTKAVSEPLAITWGSSTATLEARWACCTTAPHGPTPPAPTEPHDPTIVKPTPPAPTEPHDPTIVKPTPPTPTEPRDPTIAKPTAPADPEPQDPTIAKPIVPLLPDVLPVIPPLSPEPTEPDDIRHEESFEPPEAPAIDVPLVPPPPKDEWIPGSLSLSVDGDVSVSIDDVAKRAVEGRVCKGVNEAAVATAAKQLVLRTESFLREAASAKGGDLPSAHVALRLTAFDAKAIRQAVNAAVSGLANHASFENALAADLASIAEKLHAELKGLSFEAEVQGTRPKSAPLVPEAHESESDAAGLIELSSAFFSYTSKDAWSAEAPDEKIKANALLEHDSFRRAFRSGPNDYFRVATHVANALSKDKQRLEIRVYHHADRRSVGEQRAAALKKLWEYEQKLTGGGREETFSKKAWLKTVLISIRYVPLTDPSAPNVITFAVGAARRSARDRTKAVSAPVAIAWGAAHARLDASWLCCTHGNTDGDGPGRPGEDSSRNDRGLLSTAAIAPVGARERPVAKPRQPASSTGTVGSVSAPKAAERAIPIVRPPNRRG